MALTVNTNVASLMVQANLNRASASTKFGTGMILLDGSAGVLTFQVGAGAGASEKISLSLSDNFSSESLFVAPKSVAAVPENATTTGSNAIVEGVYKLVAIDGTDSRNTSGDAALETALEGKRTALDAASKALAATPGDAALETALATAQADYDLSDNALKDDLLAKKPLIDSAISDNLDSTLNAIDAALEKINASRADLGAKQNRFMSTIDNLNCHVAEHHRRPWPNPRRRLRRRVSRASKTTNPATSRNSRSGSDPPATCSGPEIAAIKEGALGHMSNPGISIGMPGLKGWKWQCWREFTGEAKSSAAPDNYRDARVVAIFFKKALKLLALPTITITKVI